MIVAAALLSLLIGTQSSGPDTLSPSVPSPTTAVAARAVRPPVLDGRDDDLVWREAQPITDFREWQPTEGAPSRFRTEARVAYDASNLYVFVRAFDPHPDSIIRVLARRDTWTPADQIGVLLDSYHDRRTGYEFIVNAAGVKVDQAIYDDGNEDGAWDAVWEVATRIDSLGWSAEFRIPLSQLRYGSQREHTFGIAILRDIYRYSERTAWPLFRQSRAGMVSQFGEVTGLVDLEAPRRLEAAPYAVTRNSTSNTPAGFGRAQDWAVGADLKYRVASNVTLDATINPDFGQVEADPAVFNLTAYESFFDERRPFFVAGRGLFQFDVNCTAVNCNSEGLFYSRRIGRTPHLAGLYGDNTPQQPATILGAAKLTGRLPSGLTLGFLEAVTERVGRSDTTFEPATNYAVFRLRQDLRGGETSVGGILTAVNRDNDRFSAPYLHRSAYSGALDFRHRFPGRTYEISATLDFSRVAGSPQAIAATQQSSVHFYQRPDAGLSLDTTRISLGGNAQVLKFAKVGGQHVMFETSYLRWSPGFELNDIGFLRRADQQSWSTWVGFFDRHPRRYYRRFQWNANWWQYWTSRGLPLERAANTNLHVTLRNSWSVHMGGTAGQLGTTYCDRCARGGPAVRHSPYLAPWAGINGDDRRAIVPYVWVNYWRGDEGRSHSVNLSPELDFKVSTRFTSALSLSYTRNRDDSQWFGNFTDTAGTRHYTFAHLEQRTLALTARLNCAITPVMSLQLYAQPFLTKGTYSDVRELATPRAASYANRYAPYSDTAVTNHPGGFNYRAFQSNVVFRWEYRPGSTLFLVWSEGRQGSLPAEGGNSWRGELADLFRLHPSNTFLVKVSYWLNY